MHLQIIQKKIYEIRNQRVMLDFDLAVLYEIETRALKQAVRRNMDSFPDDFMFQLTKKEWQELITNCDNLPEGVKFSPSLPFAFTEHGIPMLATILKTKKARQTTIFIMRAFIALTKMAFEYRRLAEMIKKLGKKYDRQFTDVYQALNYLIEKDKEKEKEKEMLQNRNRIGFKRNSE